MRNVKGLSRYKELGLLLERMGSIIFVPTCQASGTWFVLDLLRAHDEINWVMPTAYWRDPIIKELNVKRLLKDDSVVVLHTHFGQHAVKSALMENIFGFSDHIVTSIRNPLRSILTSYGRARLGLGDIDGNKKDNISDDSPDKNWGQSRIIHGYIELTELIKKHNFFIVPVDLYLGKSRLERYFLLRDLFDFVQLPYNHYMKKLANTWHKSNTLGTRKESVRLLFDTKNVEGIKQIMPKEYDLLIQSKDILKPFFESQGYSKEDLWWW